MKTLDDILIGFLIFFTLDRAIRVFSTGVVEPYIDRRTNNQHVVETWKLGVEFGLLLAATFFVWRYRRVIRRIDTT
jgi:hypothetical protein